MKNYTYKIVLNLLIERIKINWVLTKVRNQKIKNQKV
jgi:hypothetical protein